MACNDLELDPLGDGSLAISYRLEDNLLSEQGIYPYSGSGSFVDGKFHRGYHLDTQYQTINGVDSHPWVGDVDASLAFWVRMGNNDSAFVLDAGGNSTERYGLTIRYQGVNSGTTELRLHKQTLASGSLTFPSNSWALVTYTYNSATQLNELRFNGSLVCSGSLQMKWRTALFFRFAHFEYANATTAWAEIDQIMYFNKTLSSADITELQNMHPYPHAKGSATGTATAAGTPTILRKPIGHFSASASLTATPTRIANTINNPDPFGGGSCILWIPFNTDPQDKPGNLYGFGETSPNYTLDGVFGKSAKTQYGTNLITTTNTNLPGRISDGKQAMSVKMYWDGTTFDSYERHLTYEGSGPNDISFRLRHVNSSWLTMQTATTGGNVHYQNILFLPSFINQWVHIVFSWDWNGSTAQLRWMINNGTWEYTTNSRPASFGSTYQHDIGAVTAGSSSSVYFDQFRLFNTPLNESQARWLYHEDTSNLLDGHKARFNAKATLTAVPTVKPPVVSTFITATATLTAVPTILHNGSASLISAASLLCNGTYVPPILGSASLTSVSKFTVSQSIIFQMWEPILGSASLSSVGTLLCDSVVYGIQKGEASLIGTSTLTCEGELIGNILGAASLQGLSTLTLDGIITTPSYGAIVDELEIKVTALEDSINNMPSGTDFLLPEDIRGFFTADEIGVLYGV